MVAISVCAKQRSIISLRSRRDCFAGLIDYYGLIG